MKTYLRTNTQLPYSKAVMHDEKYTLEVAGQIGMDSLTGKLETGFVSQVKKIMDNTKSILAEYGWNFSNLIKVRVYLKDMGNYASFNAIYATYFASDFPSRVAVAVSDLPMNAEVEVEFTASGNKMKIV